MRALQAIKDGGQVGELGDIMSGIGWMAVARIWRIWCCCAGLIIITATTTATSASTWLVGADSWLEDEHDHVAADAATTRSDGRLLQRDYAIACLATTRELARRSA